MHELLTDPWSLSLAERADYRTRHARDQARWLPRLARLVEPPAPDQEFPAFLLATPWFFDLAARIASAEHARDLDTATSDTLQRFVDHYRGWLTDEREPVWH